MATERLEILVEPDKTTVTYTNPDEEGGVSTTVIPGKAEFRFFMNDWGNDQRVYIFPETEPEHYSAVHFCEEKWEDHPWDDVRRDGPLRPGADPIYYSQFLVEPHKPRPDGLPGIGRLDGDTTTMWNSSYTLFKQLRSYVKSLPVRTAAARHPYKYQFIPLTKSVIFTGPKFEPERHPIDKVKDCVALETLRKGKPKVPDDVLGKIGSFMGGKHRKTRRSKKSKLTRRVRQRGY